MTEPTREYTKPTKEEMDAYEAEVRALNISSTNEIVEKLQSDGYCATTFGPDWYATPSLNDMMRKLMRVQCSFQRKNDINPISWKPKRLTVRLRVDEENELKIAAKSSIYREFEKTTYGETLRREDLRVLYGPIDQPREKVVVKEIINEMQSLLVATRRQEDTDNIATLLGRIVFEFDDDINGGLQRSIESLLSNLVVSSNCLICNRPLKDENSRMRGIGPSCAKRIGMNTSTETARQIWQSRNVTRNITIGE